MVRNHLKVLDVLREKAITEKSSIVFSRDVDFNESLTGIEIEQEEERLIQIEKFLEREENLDQDRMPEEDETEPHPEEETDQLPQGKSTREVRRPDYYGAQVYTIELQNEPESIEEALFSAENGEMESCNAEDGFNLFQLCMGPCWATYRLQTSWKQMGIKMENQCRWFYRPIQG
jgi:hypothetical protein